MGKDFYNVLQITRSAKNADIKAAYRKLALKFHPIKNSGDKAAEVKFDELAEAYDVLSDAKKKAIYDQYGEEGLKNGVPLGNETWSDNYTFHGDAHKVFHDFFGGDNPFSDFIESSENDKINNFGGMAGRGRKKQDPAVERDLRLSLEECYHGCIKKMKFERRVMNDDGHTSSFKEKILTINVKRGWTPGTRIIFENEGDQGPNTVPADIVFIVRDKPHSVFRREGTNLIYKHKISLGLALVGTTIHVPTLDGRVLDIPITDIVKPGYTKSVPHEGMPFVEDPNQKGNLIIEFDIEYPNFLHPDSKEYVRRALLISPTQLKKLESKQKEASKNKNEAKFAYEEED